MGGSNGPQDLVLTECRRGQTECRRGQTYGKVICPLEQVQREEEQV